MNHNRFTRFKNSPDGHSKSSAQTLEAYVVDKNYQINRPLADYNETITDVLEEDKAVINSLICIFELLSDKGEELRR